MEEDDKNAVAAKMISTSTTDPQKEEPSQIETEVGGDVAMNDSSTFPRSLLLDSSPSITPEKRKEGPETDSSFSETSTKIRRPRRRPRGSGSGSKKRKQGLSLTTSAETPTKERPGGLRGKRIDLNAGQDMVGIIYSISQACPDLMFSTISAVGPISEVVLFTPDGVARHQKGEFEILSMSVTSLVGDDGYHCRAKAKCSVTWVDDKGIMHGSHSVNSLIVAGPAKIIMVYFNKDNAKKAGARILVSPAAAAQNADADSKMLVEGQTSRLPPTTPLVADEDIKSSISTTTSTSNDQDVNSSS